MPDGTFGLCNEQILQHARHHACKTTCSATAARVGLQLVHEQRVRNQEAAGVRDTPALHVQGAQRGTHSRTAVARCSASQRIDLRCDRAIKRDTDDVRHCQQILLRKVNAGAVCSLEVHSHVKLELGSGAHDIVCRAASVK